MVAVTSIQLPSLDRLIVRYGFRASWLARELEVHPALITRWRHGAVPVPVMHLRRMAAALSVTMPELLHGSDYTQSEDGTLIEISTVSVVPIPVPRSNNKARALVESFVAVEADDEVLPEEPVVHRRSNTMLFGMDGMMLGPSNAVTYCSCGRRVR